MMFLGNLTFFPAMEASLLCCNVGSSNLSKRAVTLVVFLWSFAMNLAAFLCTDSNAVICVTNEPIFPVGCKARRCNFFRKHMVCRN